MSRLIIKALSESAANTRARSMSRHSEIMSRNYEDTKLNELDNEIVRSTNENQHHQNLQNRISLNLKNNSSYRENNLKNSIIRRINNVIEFRKAINPEIDESRWMTYMINVLEYDESIFNKHFELINAWRRERLRRKKMKKTLLVTQEELAHKKNEIFEMISSNLTREFTQMFCEFIQISCEFTQISAKTTRVKISYRLKNIYSIEPLKEEEKKKYKLWVYVIKKKLQTDFSRYDKDKKKSNTIFFRWKTQSSTSCMTE